MCSLFGILDYGKKLSLRQRTLLLSTLAKASEVRGTDATGIAYNEENKLKIFKRPKAAHSMNFHLPEDANCIMGHTRMTTQGNALFNYNNHPFEGSIENTKFALAHNGIIDNDFDLELKYKLPKNKIQTDSYVIVKLIEKERELSAKSLAKTAEQLEGAFTFTALTEQNEMYFVKGNNPLYLLYWRNLGLYVYTSTEEIMKKALSSIHFLSDNFDILKLRSGEILKINSNGKCECSEFSDAHLYRCRFLSAYGYYPWESTKKKPKREQAYIDNLKAVSSTYGYSPDDIDHMINSGYSPEEIEEIFLYGGYF